MEGRNTNIFPLMSRKKNCVDKKILKWKWEKKENGTQQKSKSVNQEVIEKGKINFFAFSVLYFLWENLLPHSITFFFFYLIIETVLGPEK